MAYNDIVGRAAVSEAHLPDQVLTEIFAEAPAQSVVLSRARRVAMSSAKSKQPVLSTLPEAFWVDGDTGLKQTTTTGWENLTMTAEELAVIVPIPDALVADAQVPLWEQIKPLIVEAIGQKIDAAALFGVDKPDSWPEGLVPAAIKAGNTVAAGDGADLGVDVATLAGKVAKQGYQVNGFLSEPGLNWELIGLRTAQGAPIYAPSIAEGQPDTLFGRPLDEVYTGGFDAAKAKLIAVDWSRFVVGIRQDVTYDLFSEGVITDANGKVLFNLMQQDAKALRVVMRLGYQVAAPATRVGRSKKIYPAGVLTPAKLAAETNS
ncbi:phage major capsid protein [Corynebacterium sp. zg-331]|uniref:phage major capsid protein n=1 Tax=unclassified Corynebacterium TaxID=2624378 RepID=UPI00128D923A|nr:MULTISPECIES: phage major capsid protein [unclassified Corynebacterium]MBC3186294.1 phage major capsid protein [Corynebacterium sp. zg-331]MPV52783.1 phage major capsid protein [Corynebacterium sp. zg331]